MLILRTLAFHIGMAIVFLTLFSAIRTFVLPRGVFDILTRSVFRTIRGILSLPLHFADSYHQRDRIMAFFAPISLIALVPTWYILTSLGYAIIFWALGIDSWVQALYLSGSSLLTLGYDNPQGLAITIISFSEAALGLLLVALLIAYLPTMYSAFSRREAAVTLLEVRAGNPPSAVEMLLRYNRIHGLDKLSEIWRVWEAWFAEIEESHTSLPALVFFRSPRPEGSWVNAAGAVMDAASLTRSSIDIPTDAQADLCIRAGFIALRRIADVFGYTYHPDPVFPSQTIRITRNEFDEVFDRLAEAGVPMKPDRDQAWRDFAGWRVNYDEVMTGLQELTMAPYAPWSAT